MDRVDRGVGLLGKILELLGKPFYRLLVKLLPFLALLIIQLLHFIKQIVLWPTKVRLPRLVIRWPEMPKVKRVVIPRRMKTIMVGLATVGVVLLPLVLAIFKDLPSPDELLEHQPKLTTHILDRSGNELFKIYKDENRSLVSIDQLPGYLIDATVAIEDKNFWSHSGFSITGIVRAFYRNYIGKKNDLTNLQGGSTITQQLIKNTLLTSEKTWVRKIRELVLAVGVEREFSKKEILEMYFNEVSYGGTAYGIQEASQQYFGKDPKDLSLPEAALLAGLPAAPTVYSPLGINPELSKSRQNEVLRRMVADGYLTPEKAEAAKSQPLIFVDGRINIKAPHFVMFVRDILVSKFGEEMVNHGGLRVTTTLDLPLQEEVQTIVSEEVSKLSRLHVGNGAALITDPADGDILAMVGSVNYFDFNNDGQVNVTLRPRQPGSSIKPVNYAAALQRGFTPASIILDAPITYNIPGSKPYSPVNYDGRFHGPVTVRTALASSYNVPAVKVLSTIGVEAMIDQGEKMGIETWGDRSRFGLSLTLGGGEVTMTDMAEVYGTLANYGRFVSLDPILRVENSRGVALFEKKVDSQEVLPEGIAYQITNILADNSARAAAFGTHSILNIPGHEVAVKTGTTNSLRDNWTIGYTSDRVGVAWVGNNDNSPMSYIASGITGASPIWNQIMTLLLKRRNEGHIFPLPEELVRVRVCTLTGQLACEGCPAREELFVPGTEPQQACRPEVIEEIKQKQTEEQKNRDRILEGAATQR